MRADVGSHFDPELFELFSRDAQSIYKTIADFSEDQLENTLHDIMQDYFFYHRAKELIQNGS
jgi:hypothetical protein